jgi:hypothetical protein
MYTTCDGMFLEGLGWRISNRSVLLLFGRYYVCRSMYEDIQYTQHVAHKHKIYHRVTHTHLTIQISLEKVL